MNDDESSSPELPESRLTAPTSDRAAFVVHLQATKKGHQGQARCPELDPVLLERVRDAGQDWRDEKYRLRHIWNLLKDRQLPGLAIVYEPSTNWSLPQVQPLDMTFEPLLLDETSPTIVELGEHATGESMNGETRSRLSSPLRRVLIRIGLPVFWFVYLSFRLLGYVVEHGIQSWRTHLFIALYIVAIAVPVFVVWLRQKHWILIPGGVIVRKTSLRRLRTNMKRYTPSDTVLILAPKQPGWMAKLHREESYLESRMITQLECIALLGAWQSPLPPPEMNKLVDLQ